MHQTNLTLRQMSIEDIDQYNELLRYAFQVTEKTLLNVGWDRDDIRKSKPPVLEHAYVLGCFDRETLVSQFAVYPLAMNIHAATYQIGFITSVATYPEYSGRGIMSRLMKQSLEHMRAEGQSLALLFPYSIPLYRHRGWEIISDVMTWRIPDVQLPKDIKAPGYVRRVAEDNPDLLALHDTFSRQTHGCLYRSGLAWEEYWRWDVDDTVISIYYSKEDQPLGYMVYRIDEDIMYVKEMIWLCQEARKGLFQYMAAHDSMINEVQGNNYSGKPIAFSLYDSEIKETIRPYIMGRIIDVEQFLQHYSFQPGHDGTVIAFQVSDPFLEWNNRTFTLRIQGGKGILTDAVAEHRVALSIGTLTTLLMGYQRASELALLEMLQAEPATVGLLDALIYSEKPYISDYI